MIGGMSRAAGRRVALVALLLLSGCWLQPGADAGHTRFNWVESGLTRENVGTLHELWSAEFPGSPSEPIVSGGRVFVRYANRSAGGGVRAYDAATGATLWDQVLVGTPSDPAIGLGVSPVAFVGDDLWTGSSRLVNPSIDLSYCDGISHVLAPATGARLGSTLGYPSVAVASGPTVVRTLVIPGSSGCGAPADAVLEVSRREPDGSMTSWRSATLGSAVGLAVPTLTDEYVLLPHRDSGGGFVIDAYPIGGCGGPACSPTWTTSLGVAEVTPVVVGEVRVDGSSPILVDISGGDPWRGALVALDRETGAELWRIPFDRPVLGAALADGTFYVTLSGGTVSSLVAFPIQPCGEAACEPLWTASVDSPALSPTVGGGVVYVVGPNKVVGFDADGCGSSTCTPLVSVPVPTTGASLSLAEGRLYVPGPNRITALGPATG